MGIFMMKGILIGLLFGMPAGAVGAMTAQRTLNYGMKAGLLTGLGSSVADCLYACIGACGLTLISDFLLGHQSMINLIGGCLILVMGIGMLTKKTARSQKPPVSAAGIRMFVSSFAVGITNPAAILTFLFAFSWFGIDGQTGLADGIGLVCGVFIGTYIWWGTLSGVVTLLKKKAKKDHPAAMNRIFGIILILFGAVVIFLFIILLTGYFMLRSKLHAVGSFEVLDTDFYSMEYEGDYGLDRFIQQGGASSDLDVAKFVADDMFYGLYDLDSALDGFGCSTLAARNKEGDELFGRNFDWGKSQAVVLHTKPQNGYESVSTANLDFLSFGMNLTDDSIMTKLLSMASVYAPLDGMNEKGLSIAVLMIEDQEEVDQQTGKPDITTTTAIRLLLDQAADVEEALYLLNQYDMHASAGLTLHFAMADAKGNHVAVEYIKNEMIVTQTDAVTNFYLSEGEKYGIGSGESHTRYEILKNWKQENKFLSEEQMRDVLDSVSKHNFESEQSTEWSIVYNLSNLEAVYYHREDFNKAYKFSLDNEGGK